MEPYPAVKSVADEADETGLLGATLEFVTLEGDAQLEFRAADAIRLADIIRCVGPEVVSLWRAAMEAHATQVSSRNHVEVQLARSRLLGIRAGVDHAIALYPNEPLLFGSLVEAVFWLRRSVKSWLAAGMRSILLATSARFGFPRLFFYKVAVNDYGLFKYPDYTLPLSVKMAEVSRDYQIDVLHVHYAVPHATAAILALSKLPHRRRPRVITTLHGTDTTLLGARPRLRSRHPPRTDPLSGGYGRFGVFETRDPKGARL
jgi:hypothetical protein